MKKIVQIPAYLWAVICLLLIPVTFIGSQSFSSTLARLPFMKVNPIYSGGEIAKTIEEAGLTTEVYNPVFEALIGESKTGFVQVRFSSPDTLPLEITRDIDFNNDQSVDFILSVNTETSETSLKKLNPDVLDLTVSTRVNDKWIVRVGLINPSKK